MARCPLCGGYSTDGRSWCESCRQTSEYCNDADDRAIPVHDVNSHDTAPLVRIARFQSAAEAGYFADALRRAEKVPAEVAVDEEREAMHGSWSVRFTLLVPEPWAEFAA